jgi:hypothetical protein
MKRRRNLDRRVSDALTRARRSAASNPDMALVAIIVEEYTVGPDAADLQRTPPGEYMALWADDVWMNGDVLFDGDEYGAATAHEILKVAAIDLDGEPKYGMRQRNPAARRERNALHEIRAHASDKRWSSRIPGGTTRAPASFERRTLVHGSMVELEHTTDPLIAMEIAMDHLATNPGFYRALNPDPDACVLGRWAWDRSSASCGPGAPAATQRGASEAAQRLARKRWTLPPRQQRMAARLLR